MEALLISIRESSPFFFYLYVLLNGLYVGGFLNVVIYRLPKILHHEWKGEAEQYLGVPSSKKSLSSDARYLTFGGRSHCASCGSVIPFWHIIPVFSWAFLRGKAACCGSSFSIRYPLIEAITGLVTLGLFLAFDPAKAFYFSFAFYFLICIFFIDIENYLIPSVLSNPLMWLGLMFNCTNQGLIGLNNGVMSVISSYALIWVFTEIWKRLRKVDFVLGGGDVALITGSAAWIGLLGLPMMMLMASVFTIIFSVLKMNKEQPAFLENQRTKVIQFGPGLSLSFFISLVFYSQLGTIINAG
ncbi:Type 4 prepilin-like proteins leader peptide-processing enzyme [compost metagenome]